MTGVLFTLAIVAAVAVLGWRRLRVWRAERQRPGASLERALVVGGFDEIDGAIAAQRCRCGGHYSMTGETSRAIGLRRFRISRLVCKECDREILMYFDVTLVFH
ncbi:hypothetical protein L6Q96_07505 [Candidatus Binatia bacterium]|nr:hypothetical protein [Candidatus Binatia bacterium]